MDGWRKEGRGGETDGGNAWDVSADGTSSNIFNQTS